MSTPVSSNGANSTEPEDHNRVSMSSTTTSSSPHTEFWQVILRTMGCSDMFIGIGSCLTKASSSHTLSCSSNVLKSRQPQPLTKAAAHWIRNQGTNHFRAAVNLHSLHRWCLTGTPIQNRLEDLVSLLKFLHFEPFARTSIFQKHILEPLATDTSDRTLGLKALLHTVCLRRSESLLDLPTPQAEEIRIALPPEERFLYNDVLRRCAIEIDDALSSGVKIKSYSYLFTAIMRLRRLCNHGTYGKTKFTLASDKNWESDLDVEMDCEICGVSSEDSWELVSAGDLCPRCGQSLPQTLRGMSRPSHLNGEAIWLSASASGLQSRGPEPATAHGPHLSAKLQAVVNNLEKMSRDSKR